MTSVQNLPDISATPAWDALRRHHEQIGDTHLRQFFDEDSDRGRELTTSVGDLYIDYSKHRITRETLQLLVNLARAANLEERRDQMFSGAHINTSEDRAVLHTALRLPRDAELIVDGHLVALAAAQHQGGHGRLADPDGRPHRDGQRPGVEVGRRLPVLLDDPAARSPGH